MTVAIKLKSKYATTTATATIIITIILIGWQPSSDESANKDDCNLVSNYHSSKLTTVRFMQNVRLVLE